MKKLFLAALILAAFASCKKDKDSSSDSTKVYFYTNAHTRVNCGGFDVNVYVDDKLCGVLQNSFIPEGVNPCEEKGGDGHILVVEVEKDIEHTYTAVSECGINWVCKGGFCFSDNECHSVFLDFYEGMDFPE